MSTKLITFLSILVLALGLGYVVFKGKLERQPSPSAQQAVGSPAAAKEQDPPASAAQSGPLILIEAGDREFDGFPALALTFNQPLAKGKDYDAFIQVFEMPSRPGEQAPKKESDDAASEGDEELAQQASAPKERVSQAEQDTDVSDGAAVSGAWVLGDNPRLLYFPHIKPQTRYIIRIATGLPSAGGAQLSQESRYSVLSAAVAPTYYFASQGMVLPAGQNGGLPVVTVNVPEVDLQFLRVKENALPAFLDKVVSGPVKAQPSDIRDEQPDAEDESEQWTDRRNNLHGAVDYWELDRIHSLTDSVYSGRFVTEQKPNRRAVTFLPVEDIKELQEPGLYVAVMSQPNRFRYDHQVTYFYVSDLGLHARLFPKSADIYVSSLVNGKAVNGAEVLWLDTQGKQLLRGQTDADGRAAFSERPQGAKVLLARKERQLSLIALKEPALDLSEFALSGAPGKAVRLFAWSGRDLYRPGERFHLSILARDADGQPIAAQPVQAVLKRPDGKALFSSFWQPMPGFEGYYHQELEIPLDAPTGFWSLELRADPADKVASTVFRFGVEEFLPERMKLDLQAQEKPLGRETALSVVVRGDYLYGAPAAGNRLVGVAQFERNVNPLATLLPGFSFGDVNEDSAKARTELPEAKLDEKGAAAVRVDLAALAKRQSPFTVRGAFSLLESGGRPVVRSIERVYWPAAALVGLRPLFTGDYARENSPAQFEVVRAAQDGTLLGSQELGVRLFREDRHYYWRFDDQGGWNSGFSEQDELVASSSLRIAAGARATLTLPVQYGRYRVEILDPESGLTMKYRFYAGWSAKADEIQGARPDKVALRLDKPAYREGEDQARLTITPPHGGEALVTVEGDRTLWSKRMPMPLAGATIELPINKEWRRHDLYVTVLVLRPGAEGARVTPARALGVIHLPLERSARKVALSLEAPTKVLPEKPMLVRIKAPALKGQKALCTVSAVDVGILNITRFATPDPHGFFFGQLRYGADLHDVYGRLIEKMAGAKGGLRFGGDAMPKATAGLPKKVRLVDIFSGPLQLNEQGEAQLSLTLPDFNGSLRLMAVAASADSFGSQEAEVTVAAPLVAELSAPRFLRLGDKAELALDLHNLSGGPLKLSAMLNDNEGLLALQADKPMRLNDREKVVLRFPVQAPAAFLGLAELRAQVKAETKAGRLQLDRRFALQVQAPTPEEGLRRSYVLKPGERLNLDTSGAADFFPASLRAQLSIASQPPLDLRPALQGLLHYPYGCAEQTASSAYPHLFIDAEEARQLGLKAYSSEQRAAMIAKAMSRLAAYQAANGGYSLWGGAADYEYWLSAYIADFLVDAREQGFAAPEVMSAKTMDFLLRGLQEGLAALPAQAAPRYDEDSIWNDHRYAGAGRFAVLSYGGYVLARQARVPLATLRQLYDLRGNAHSGLSLIHLGLALRLMGDEAKGDAAIAEGIKKPRQAGAWWGDYGSSLRDAALSYALLNRHGVQAEGKVALLMLAANEMGKNQWYSTQEQLALFLASREFLQAKQQQKPWRVDLMQGKAERSLEEAGVHTEVLDAARLDEGLSIVNRYDAPLFVDFSLRGNPFTAAPPAKTDLIELERSLYTASGQPLAGRRLSSGDNILVHIRVKSKQRIANALVVDAIPAGLEVENLNLAHGEGMGQVMIHDLDPGATMADRAIKHVEFRDDRFVAALKLDGEAHLFYRARVVTPGVFVWPALYAEDMYQPQTHGRGKGPEQIEVAAGPQP